MLLATVTGITTNLVKNTVVHQADLANSLLVWPAVGKYRNVDLIIMQEMSQNGEGSIFAGGRPPFSSDTRLSIL